ncbi:hypothetical protein F4823DRAFT_641220 [Ustulina deusta]|nr:hypothetical protein F4823DRAFT_641220 [Ustulina deusta]
MEASQPIPALPPPPGVTPNFDHPSSLKHVNNIAISVAIPITTIFFILRTYTRVWLKRTWIVEDWLTTIAYVGTISFCVVGAATMDHYGGKHQWDITPNQAHEAFYWFNVASIHYGITICIAKIAVLCLYRRVFSPIRWSPFDISIVALINLLALFYIATNIVKIWECIPRAKIWDPTIPGTCINTPMLLNVSGLFNTVTDLIILLLPFKAVWRMNMNLKKKTMVVLVFTFGLSAPIFSLVGVVVRVRGSKNPDKTWVQPEIIQWGLAELTAALLCVCFPELGPLWKKRPRAGPTTSIKNGRYRLRDFTYRKRLKNDLSTGTSLSTTLNASELSRSAYVELEQGFSYKIQGAGESNETTHPTQAAQQVERQGEITVTQEFNVDSARGD